MRNTQQNACEAFQVLLSFMVFVMPVWPQLSAFVNHVLVINKLKCDNEVLHQVAWSVILRFG